MQMITLDVGGTMSQVEHEILMRMEYFQAWYRFRPEVFEKIVFVDRCGEIFRHCLHLAEDEFYDYPERYRSELDFYGLSLRSAKSKSETRPQFCPESQSKPLSKPLTQPYHVIKRYLLAPVNPDSKHFMRRGQRHELPYTAIQDDLAPKILPRNVYFWQEKSGTLPIHVDWRGNILIRDIYLEALEIISRKSRRQIFLSLGIDDIKWSWSLEAAIARDAVTVANQRQIWRIRLPFADVLPVALAKHGIQFSITGPEVNLRLRYNVSELNVIPECQVFVCEVCRVITSNTHTFHLPKLAITRIMWTNNAVRKVEFKDGCQTHYVLTQSDIEIHGLACNGAQGYGLVFDVAGAYQKYGSYSMTSWLPGCCEAIEFDVLIDEIYVWYLLPVSNINGTFQL